MRKKLYSILLLVWLLMLAACVPGGENYVSTQETGTESNEELTTPEDTAGTDSEQQDGHTSQFNLADIPEYSSSPYVAVNDNMPFFTEADYTTEAFENYSELDELGRCGVAYANVCRELMPTEDRESISEVKPSGWMNKEYDSDLVDGRYIYNRCHLIGFQLTGENANEQNLITGTRYMNTQGMLPFEDMVADYVRETNNHVLYRVTPVFFGDNLVASGVLMEAWSVEDNGEGVCFNVYIYNVQPGISIDYATGDNWEISGDHTVAGVEQEYVLNTSSKKFHNPDCSSVKNMADENRENYIGTRDELIAKGYDPCGSCNP